MTRFTYAESLVQLMALFDRAVDADARLRAQQLFMFIRSGRAPRTVRERVRLRVSGMRQYLACCGLSLWALVSVLLMRLQGRGAYVHQGVDLPFAGRQDQRSAYVLTLLDARQMVLFWHFADAWASLKSMFSHPVLTCHPEAIVRVIWPFVRMKDWALRVRTEHAPLEHDELSRHARVEALYARTYVRVLMWLFTCLRTRRLAMLDDPRNVPVFCRAARLVGVQTLGYMHGKFNDFHVGLAVESFDCYVVWSAYYRQKIERMWGGQYPGRIVVSGLTRTSLPVMEKAIRMTGEPLQVLWLDEDEVELERVRPFFEKLAEVSDVHVRFRLKPRPAVKQAALPAWYVSTFERDQSATFWDALVRHRVDVVIGCHSTALLEAGLMGVVPLGLQISLDYARDLFDDGLVLGCPTPEVMQRCLEDMARRDASDGMLATLGVRQAIEPFDAAVMPIELCRLGFPLREDALPIKSTSSGASACR